MGEQRIPPHIIDLRRPITPPKAKRSLLPSRIQRRPYLHHVPMRIAWRLVGREMGKYGLALAIVSVPIFVGVVVWNINRVTDSFTKNFQNGIHQTAQGYVAINERRVSDSVVAFTKATSSFHQAGSTLDQAEGVLWGVGKHLVWVAPRLTAAHHVVEAANELSTASLAIAEQLPSTGTWDPFSVTTTGVIRGSFGALQPLSRNPEVLDQVAEALLRAYAHIEAVPTSLIPGSYRDQLEPVLSLLPALFGSPDQAAHLVTVLRDLLGAPTAKEYLVLFQNDDEARATGGFPGTFLLLKFDHGTFTITDAPGNGPYALRDHVGKGTLPPQPILAIAPYWTFQDAAWFADVPTSASAVLDFYEQARGFRPNGVFFLTPHLMERLLSITGPVTLTDKDSSVVNATNFVRLIEEQVEFKYDKSLNAPKSVLINVVPEILTKLMHLDSGKAILALTTFFDEFQRGNMSLVSEVPAVANATAQLHWSGALGTDREHTLSIIRTNLGGGKTDRAIAESDVVRYEPVGNEWKVTLTITREHFGDPADKLHGPTNRSFIRVYVDPRARLLDLVGESIPTGIFKEPAKGASVSTVVTTGEGTVLTDTENTLRVTHESGYMVFGFWSLLPAGKQQTITLQYAIPKGESEDFRVWLRKQPGNIQAKWRIEIADSTLQPLDTAFGWTKKQGVWQWNGLSTYNETIILKKGG